MPLDKRKVAHIQKVLKRLFDARAQPVVLTLKRADNTTYTLTVNAIWRPQADNDPAFDPVGHGWDDIKAGDVVAVFNQVDVTLAQLRSCLYASLPGPFSGPQPATRYILTSIDIKGMAPGGDRFITSWDRQR